MFDAFIRYSEVSAAWSAAIGTTFAACVALWLGLSESRRREKEKKEAMLIVVSGVVGYLDELIIEMRSTFFNIREARKLPVNIRKEYVKRSARNLMGLDLDHLSSNELGALSALPGQVSEKIYVGLTCAKLVKGALSRRGEIAESIDPDADYVLERWQTQAAYAVSMFEEALKECQKHARVKLLAAREQKDDDKTRRVGSKTPG